jgi:MFS family permease
MGVIGAMSPEIVRLYKIRTKPIPSFSASYYVISILFALLGGLVAVILPTTTAWGAFYAGAALPTIVSGIGGKPPVIPNEPSILTKEYTFKVPPSEPELRKDRASKEPKLFVKPKEMTFREFLGILYS